MGRQSVVCENEKDYLSDFSCRVLYVCLLEPTTLYADVVFVTNLIFVPFTSFTLRERSSALIFPTFLLACSGWNPPSGIYLTVTRSINSLDKITPDKTRQDKGVTTLSTVDCRL